MFLQFTYKKKKKIGSVQICTVSFHMYDRPLCCSPVSIWAMYFKGLEKVLCCVLFVVFLFFFFILPDDVHVLHRSS